MRGARICFEVVVVVVVVVVVPVSESDELCWFMWVGVWVAEAKAVGHGGKQVCHKALTDTPAPGSTTHQ